VMAPASSAGCRYVRRGGYCVWAAR
jgi:hypothetical protein